ncbi:carbohydrate-binding module family 13 protein [Trichoderma austrokoningii]
MAPLLDGIYIISNKIPHRSVLGLDGATKPFASPIAGAVGLTTLRPGVYSLRSEFDMNAWLAAPTDVATLAQIESSKHDTVFNEVTRWKITEIEGNYQPESVPFPGKAMDLEMASPADGTRVILYPNNNTPNQNRIFIPHDILI